MMIHGISSGFNLLLRHLLQQLSKPEDDYDVFTNQFVIKGLQDDQQQHSKLEEDVFTNQIITKYLQDEQQQLGIINIYIPEDVVLIEIISRLPINCLIQLLFGRFKPSSWSSILFDLILRQLFPYDLDHDHDMIIIIHLPPSISALSFLTLAPLDGIFSEAPSDIFYNPYVGFLDGLVVLSPRPFAADHIYLWNPETFSFAHTKPCHTPEFDSHQIFMAFIELEYFGCGFCAQFKDNKVVRIRSLASDRRKNYPLLYEDTGEIYTSWDGDSWDIFDEWFETERFFDANDTILDMDHDDWDVSKFLDAIDFCYDYDYLQSDYVVDLYSLNTDSWRRVAVDAQLFSSFDGGANFYPQRGFTTDTFSWLVDADPIPGTDQVLKLLTFHMTSEVFQVTSLPNNMLGANYYFRVRRPFPIQFFNGTIGMAIPRPDSLSSFEIWLLLDYGVMDSWTKLCTIGPFPDVGEFVGVWKNGKVFLESTSGEILVGDLVTNKIIQNLHIKVSQVADFCLHLKT